MASNAVIRIQIVDEENLEQLREILEDILDAIPDWERQEIGERVKRLITDWTKQLHSHAASR